MLPECEKDGGQCGKRGVDACCECGAITCKAHTHVDKHRDGSETTYCTECWEFESAEQNSRKDSCRQLAEEDQKLARWKAAQGSR